MVLINRFGQNFVQNYVEFNGGGRGSNSRANRVRGRPVPKPSGASWKILDMFTPSTRGAISPTSLEMWLMYPAQKVVLPPTDPIMECLAA